MAIFYSYFDHSGTRGDSESLPVAGFLASVEQWDAFRTEWEGAMNDFGVSHLHMKDFAHGSRHRPHSPARRDRDKGHTFGQQTQTLPTRSRTAADASASGRMASQLSLSSEHIVSQKGKTRYPFSVREAWDNNLTFHDIGAFLADLLRPGATDRGSESTPPVRVAQLIIELEARHGVVGASGLPRPGCP
jgi:hypothetical protein